MRCKKCAGKNIFVSWHRGVHDCGYSEKNKIDKEHLHYNCGNCHYDWCGPTKDNQIESFGSKNKFWTDPPEGGIAR